MLAAASLVAVPPAYGQTSAGTPVVQSFSDTGAEQSFTVPAGVHEVTIEAIGAAGGDVTANSGPGGLGGTASGTVPVTPGQVLYVEVGGTPGIGEGTPGGFNGGGDSAAGEASQWSGAGGGGASDVRTVPRAGQATLASRLVVAAGGGGGHGGGGGGDGDPIGYGDGSASTFGGYGATLTAGGAGGQPLGNITHGGHAGSLGEGGAGGSGGGPSEQTYIYGGGGGGGGYYGGGGGTYGDGGGGGSDHVTPTATNAAVGVNHAGNPAQVSVSYAADSQPPTGIAPAIAGPSSATFTVATPGVIYAPTTLTGSPAPVVSDTGDALPTGLHLNSASGVISGTPAPGTGGVYHLVLTADNDVEPNASSPVTLTVNEAASISGPRRVEFSTGQPDSFTPTVSGYPAPTVTLVHGRLPWGLHLDTSTGRISGEASIFWTGVTSRITVRASNGIGPASTYRVRIKVVFDGCLGFFSWLGYPRPTCHLQ